MLPSAVSSSVPRGSRDPHQRTAVVVGSGVVGTTMAYFLAVRGFHVTVLERCSRDSIIQRRGKNRRYVPVCPLMRSPWAEMSHRDWPSIIGTIVSDSVLGNNKGAVRVTFDALKNIQSLYGWTREYIRWAKDHERVATTTVLSSLLWQRGFTAYKKMLVHRPELAYLMHIRGHAYIYKRFSEVMVVVKYIWSVT